MIYFAWNIIVLAIGCSAALCVGAGFMKFCTNRYELRMMFNPVERISIEFLLGIGLLAGVWQILGLLAGGWFTPITVLLVVGFVIFAGWKTALLHFRSAFAQVRLFVLSGFKSVPIAWRIIAGIVIGLFVIYFFTSLLPPKRDAMAFYMVMPKLMAFNHELVIAPGFESFSQVGMLGEMHFAAMLLFGGEMACGMLVYVLAFICAALLISLGRRCGMGFKGQWTMLLMLMTSMAFTIAIYEGKCDLFGVAMSLACIMWVLQINKSRPKMKCMFAGVFAAWAFQAKMTYMATVFPMAGMLMLWRSALELHEDNVPQLWKLLAKRCWWMILGGLIALIPHFLKDLVMYHSIMPFLFTATENSDFWFQRTSHEQTVLALIYPLALFWGRMNTGGHLSMIIPAVLPLALWLKRPAGLKEFLSSTTVQLTVIAWIGIVIWATLFFNLFITRYFLPPLLLIMILPALAVERFAVCSSRKVLVWFIIGALFAGALATYNRPKGHPGRGLAYALGFKSKEKVVGSLYTMCETVNDQANNYEKVFMATAYRYYLNEELLNSTNSTELTRQIATLPHHDKWKKIYADGYRWVIVGPETTTISADGKDILIKLRNPDNLSEMIILDSADIAHELDAELIKVDGSRVGKKPYQYGLYKLTERINAVVPTTMPE